MRLCSVFLVIPVITLGSLTGSGLEAVRARFTSVRDVQLIVEVGRRNADELERINDDFAQQFKLKRAEVWYKSPDSVRVETRIGPTKLTYIIDADNKWTKAPLKGTVQENIADKPNRRQTGLEFGILSTFLFSKMSASAPKSVKLENENALQIDFTFPRNKETGTWRVFVSAADYRLLRFDKIRDSGELKVRYCYKDHQDVTKDVRMPRRVEIYNQFGKFAGEYLIKRIDVNTNLPDSLFRP